MRFSVFLVLKNYTNITELGNALLINSFAFIKSVLPEVTCMLYLFMYDVDWNPIK